MPPKKNAGTAKSKNKSLEESSSGKAEKKGGNAVKVRQYILYIINNVCVTYVCYL